MTENKLIVLAGLIGLLAAMFVGLGEFLLHYSTLGYGSEHPYGFMLAISAERFTYGHFIAVLAAPFYLIGFWHIYKMLQPAGRILPAAITMIAIYGFIMGIVWIGSRAMIGSIIHLETQSVDPSSLGLLIHDYQLYSESLLQIIRITTFIFSAGFVYLVFRGKTNYPKWMWLVNPFFLLLLVFLIYFTMPRVGQYLAPIAMNAAYTVFFLFSLKASITHCHQHCEV